MLSLAAFWLSCGPVLAAPTQFGGAAGWGGRPEAEQWIARSLPKAQSEAAVAFLKQFNYISPNIHQVEVLRSFLAQRQLWIRRGPGAVAALQTGLSHSDPWIRHETAILLGATHIEAAASALRERLRIEPHRDVRYALEAALAELGDHSVERVTYLAKEERAEKDRRRLHSRDEEIRCCHLIDLAYGVHRPEVEQALSGLAGDDGALGEERGACEFYRKADLGTLTDRERELVGLPPQGADLVSQVWRKDGYGYRYPQIQGWPNRAVQVRVNQELFTAFQPRNLRPGYRESREYKVGRWDSRYLSVAYQGSGIEAGAGSHNRVCAGCTVDLRNGRVVSIADLFKPKTDWRTRLRDQGFHQAEKALSTPPGPNFLKGEWSYYLTPDSLVLLDTLGDGSGLELTFKREFLRDLAAPDGPLDR